MPPCGQWCSRRNAVRSGLRTSPTRDRARSAAPPCLGLRRLQDRPPHRRRGAAEARASTDPGPPGRRAGRRLGERVGVPWLGWSCGTCRYCLRGRENPATALASRLRPQRRLRRARRGRRAVLPSDSRGIPRPQAAPLLCAGLIGFPRFAQRATGKPSGSTDLERPHIVAQVARHEGGASSPSRGGATPPRRPSLTSSAPSGRAPRTSGRPKSWTPRSSSRPRASSFPARWRPSRKGERWSAPAST